MFDVTQGKEVVVQIRNKIGLLYEISKVISEKGVSVLAIFGGVCGEDCIIRLVTDDNLRAKDVLIKHRYAPEERDVILIRSPHKPGMLERVAEALNDESIDIHHIYCSSFESDKECLIVLHTSADEHAIPALDKVMV